MITLAIFSYMLCSTNQVVALLIAMDSFGLLYQADTLLSVHDHYQHHSSSIPVVHTLEQCHGMTI